MIKINHIDKYYKKRQVLFDFSMEILNDEHYIYGLVGPNGAGKTTLIKIISGILLSSNGSISVDERKDYTKWCKENIIFIPAGERGLRNKNTVYDNIMMFAVMKGVEEKKIKKLLEKYIELFNFEKLINRRVETLSMGEKKKAMLLCGLCTDMKIIIMDEPSIGLDLDAQKEIESIVKYLSSVLHKTVILSAHDVELLSKVADKYIFIYGGRKVRMIERQMKINEIQEQYNKSKEIIGENDEKVS